MQYIAAFLSLTFLLQACNGPKLSPQALDADPSSTRSFENSSTDYSKINPVDMAGEPKIIKQGFTFTEGPLWIESQQALLFSDVRENIVWRYQAPDKFDKYITETGGTNGLALGPNHTLFMCQVEARQLAALELPKGYGQAAPNFKTITKEFSGNGEDLASGKYNQTNDVIVRSDGTIYFTDPAYRPHRRELDFTAVYRVTPAGKVTALTVDYYPNGIALSPDEKWLYIINRKKIERAAVNADGSIETSKTFAMMDAKGDGMAVDDAGNIYVAARPGIQVFNPQGQHLGVINTPKGKSTNCSFGGADRKTLFVTGGNSLISIAMPIPGLP